MKEKLTFALLVTAIVFLAVRVNSFAAFTITANPSNSHPDTQVSLKWDSYPGALMYKIYRDDAVSPAVLLKTVNVNVDRDYLSYMDNDSEGAGLIPETRYNYTIYAYSDQEMQNEITSASASVSTTKMLHPTIISAVFDINSRTVTINWANNSLAVTGSTIKNTQGNVLITVNSTDSTYTFSDPDMVNDTPSQYTVVSYDSSAHTSSDSDPVTVIPIAPPIIASSTTNGTATLSWGANPYIVSFYLERSKYSPSSWGAWQAVNNGVEQEVQSITDTLGVGGLYRYRLAAKSASTYRGYSNISQTISKPLPPTNLTCLFAAPNRIDLSWINDADNESNLIVEKKTGSSSYTTIATLSKNVSSYSDNFSIIAGTDYYYRISAYDSATNLAIGNEYVISATLPASPSSLNMTLTSNTKVDLSWTDNSNNEIGFKVERKIDSGNFEELSMLPLNTCSLSDEGLTVGHTYTYRVRAYNHFGNSASYTNEVSSASNALKAPNFLEISVVSSSLVKLSWTYPESTSCKTIIERKAGSEGDWSTIAESGSGIITYNDSALSPNTRYFYRIKAKSGNYIYSVPYPNDNNGKEAYTVFSPLSISIVSSSQINLSWTDNASGEAGYRVERKTDSGSFNEISSLDANVITYSDKSVTAGHTYVYRVLLMNSPTSFTIYTNEVSTSTSNLTIPGSLELTVVSPSQIDITWDFSSPGNFTTVIERKTWDSGPWVEIANVESGKRSYSNTGLSDNTHYYYRIKASFGSSIFSQTYPNDNLGIGAFTKVNKPTNLKGQPLSDTQISLTWTSNSNGAQYVIERKTELSDFKVAGTTDVNAVSWSDVSLIPNYRYTYRIKAKTENNFSDYSDEITVACSNLSAPSSLTANGLTSTSIELNWLDNAANESGFEIWRTEGTTSNWELISSTGSNSTRYTDNDLSGNKQYSYKVRAYISNNNIYSGYSNTVTAITTVPNAPTNLNYSRTSNTSLKLTWVDNSTNESGFKVERKAGSTGNWSEIASISQNITSYSVASIDANAKYLFRVKAYNIVFNSYSYSNELDVSLSIPGTPSGITVEALSSSQVQINWTDDSSNEQGFIIERKQFSGIFKEVGKANQNTSRFIDSGLSPNQQYFYRIKAYNNNGNSAYSEIKSATTKTATVYRDIQNISWAKSAIENLTSRGIIKGKTSTTFAPNDKITRAEFVCLMIRAFNLNKTPVGSFSDVNPGNWYYSEIMTAQSLGIISGDKGYFYPNRPVTREDVAVIIVRTLKVVDKPFKGSSSDVLKKFTDRNSVSSYAVMSIASLVTENILSGRTQITLAPKSNTTRAEAALLASKIIDR